MDGFIHKFDRDNIDGQSLIQSLFAIQLKYIERKNFDVSLAKRQIRHYFTHQNFGLYST